LETIGPAGLSISTIGLGDPDQDLGEFSAIDEQALMYLAENAGGVYAYANDQESLSEVYQSYAAAFKSEYQLTYTSPSSLRDGVNRALSVSISDVPNSSLNGEEDQSLVYNPGGLVPEVAEPVPMAVFGGVMAGLVLLLFAPTAIKPILANISSQKTPEKKKPRIKLKD
jgi:hypothetical protein